MSDPIFTDVRDRSNANFLWFIKFERSFRETEQELQSDVSGSADGVRQMAYQETEKRENIHATEETGAQGRVEAEIVKLYESESGDAQSSDEQKNTKRLAAKSRKNTKPVSGSAEIVYLRRWSGE